MRRTAGVGFGAALGVLAGLGPVQAQDRATPGGWSVQVTPYVWAAGLEGRVRPDPALPRLNASASFREILEDLDAGLFLNAVAVRDRVVLAGDLSYVVTSRKGGFEAAPTVAGRAEVTQLTLAVAAGYRVLQAEGFSLDLLGGLRAWRLDAKAEARVAGTAFADASAGLDWVDPLLGFRLRTEISPQLSALVMGDVGGFGIGSQGSFQGTAVLNYRLAEPLYVSAGYRHQIVNYREGGRVVDIALSGPVLGLTLRF